MSEFERRLACPHILIYGKLSSWIIKASEVKQLLLSMESTFKDTPLGTKL